MAPSNLRVVEGEQEDSKFFFWSGCAGLMSVKRGLRKRERSPRGAPNIGPRCEIRKRKEQKKKSICTKGTQNVRVCALYARTH